MDMEPTGKWRVCYGIHRGTLMSRDSAEDDFDNREEAEGHYSDVIARFHPGVDRFGYVLWYAQLIDPNGKQVGHNNGYPYR